MYFEASLKEKAFKFLRLVSKLYAYPPRDITIEVTTRCGQNCAMCFRPALGVPEADMSPELFARIMAALKTGFGAGGPKYLNFVGLGEPLLNGSLGEMLRLAKKIFPETALNISTGLSVFDRTLMSELAFEKVINRVSVSIDGLDAGGSLHPFTGEVRKNFGLLTELKAAGGFKLRVQTLIISKERAEEVIKLAAGAGAEELQLMRIDLHAFKGEPPLQRPSPGEEREIVRFAAGRAAESGLRCMNNNSYDIFMAIASGRDRRCLTSDDHIFIDAAGKVLPCFYLREFQYGDLTCESLSAICGKRRELDFYGSQARLCAGCDIYKRDHAGGPGA